MLFICQYYFLINLKLFLFSFILFKLSDYFEPLGFHVQFDLFIPLHYTHFVCIIFLQGGTDTEQVPRHKEINEITAKNILKKWGLK